MTVPLSTLKRNSGGSHQRNNKLLLKVVSCNNFYWKLVTCSRKRSKNFNEIVYRIPIWLLPFNLDIFRKKLE